MSQQAKKEQVIKLRDKGLSFGEIAKELGISRSTVSSICQRKKEKQQQGCKNCGVLLKQTSGHRQRIFCSDRCRKAYWRSTLALFVALSIGKHEGYSLPETTLQSMGKGIRQRCYKIYKINTKTAF